MAHMSGLPDVLRAPTIESDPQAAWLWTLNQSVRFPAGEHYDYCQTNYVLVQRIVNGLSNRGQDEPIALAQFTTLGMAHSRYGDADDVVPGKASSYGDARPFRR
jgi:CubicO group peptidase (beta-lactamase class C family)